MHDLKQEDGRNTPILAFCQSRPSGDENDRDNRSVPTSESLDFNVAFAFSINNSLELQVAFLSKFIEQCPR